MNTLPSQNRIRDAKQQLKIANNSNKKCVALSNLGDAYFLAEKYDKAIINYHKALEINTNLKVTLFNLGKVYLIKTEYQKAIEVLEKAMELDPQNATALRYIAISYWTQDDMLKSAETYHKCLNLLPDDLDINFELAMIYLHKLNNLEEAEKYFEKCVQLKTEREGVYRNLYRIYQKLKKHLQASNICMTVGDLYLKKYDLENSRSAFITALDLTPDNAVGHWKLGLTMHKMGYFDLAMNRYKKAIQLTKHNVPSLM